MSQSGLKKTEDLITAEIRGPFIKHCAEPQLQSHMLLVLLTWAAVAEAVVVEAAMIEMVVVVVEPVIVVCARMTNSRIAEE